MEITLYRLEAFSSVVAPPCKMRVHLSRKGLELWMVLNDCSYCRLLNSEINITRPVMSKKNRPQFRTHLPVGIERINVGFWDAAKQMRINVLDIIYNLAIN